MYKNLNFKTKADDIISFGLNLGFDSFFVKVAILKYDFFNKFNLKGMTEENIYNKFKIIKRVLNVALPLFVNLKLLKYNNNKYYLTNHCKEYYLKSSDKYIADFINFRINFYEWDTKIYNSLARVFETGEKLPSTQDGDWLESFKNKDIAKQFANAMNQRGKYLASEILKKINLKKYKKLIDIGGSGGIYSLFFKNKFKNLDVSILEVPEVAKNTRKLLKNIKVIDGDMFNYNYNKEYDVHFYSNVFHDWSYKDVKKLINHSYENLPEKGKIIIHDGHLSHKKNNKSLLHNNITLLLYTDGRYYYYDEINDLLLQAGFRKIKVKKITIGRSLIIGEK